MSDRKPTLGMEPTECRALNIMRLAGEQADETAALERALADMTERCRTAEMRARECCIKFVMTFPLTVPEQDCCETELGRAFARDMAIAHALQS